MRALGRRRLAWVYTVFIWSVVAILFHYWF